MKQLTKLLLAIILVSLSFTTRAQETIPDSLGRLIPVNGQFFVTIHSGDTAIWHFKGYPYGYERLAKYKDVTKGYVNLSPYVLKAHLFNHDHDTFIGDTTGATAYLEVYPDYGTALLNSTYNDGSTNFYSKFDAERSILKMSYNYGLISQAIYMQNSGEPIHVHNDVGNGMAYDHEPNYSLGNYILTSYQADSVARAKIDSAKSHSFATDTTASIYNHVMVYGDSFTGGLGRNSYVWWLAKFTGLNFLNAGIGGQTSEQITARYMADSSKWKYPVILQMGRNNLTEPDSIKADIARCVAAAASKGNNKYMILTIFNNAKTTEFIGQTAYTNIISLNTYLQTTYPGHVVDWRTYIVGLRRTPAMHQDTLDFTNDVSPAWLRLNNGVTDTLHLSSTGYKYAAGYIAQHISMLKTDTAKVLTTSIAFNLFKGMYGNVQTNGIAFGGNDGKNTSDSSHLSYDPVAQQTTMTVTSKTNTAIGPPLNLVENYNGSPAAGFGANLPFYISGADGIKHLQGWLGYSRGVNDTTARFLLKINHNGVLNTVMKADTNFNTIFGMGAGVYVPTSTLEAWGQGSQLALDYNSSKRSTFTVNLNGDLVLQNTRLMGIDVTPVGALLQTPVGATNVAGLKISRGNKLATITGGIQDGAIEVDTVSTSAANFDVNMIIGSTRKHFVLTSGLQAAGDIPYYATATNSYSRLTLGGAGTVLHGGSTAPSYTQIVSADLASSLAFGTVTFNTKINASTATNGPAGSATLVAGTVTVANTSVTANSIIVPVRFTAGGTTGTYTYTVTAGTSFTITSSSNLDTSVLKYFIIN